MMRITLPWCVRPAVGFVAISLLSIGQLTGQNETTFGRRAIAQISGGSAQSVRPAPILAAQGKKHLGENAGRIASRSFGREDPSNGRSRKIKKSYPHVPMKSLAFPLQVYTVYDCWWTDEIDLDGDGYASFRKLQIDVDVDDGQAHNVYLEVYQKLASSSIYTLYLTTPNFQVIGNRVDPVWVAIGSPNPELDHNAYDFQIEVYEVEGAGVKAFLNADGDADLDDQPFESASQDITYGIEDCWWTNLVDQNGDGYARSAILQTDVDVDDGLTHLVYLKVYCRSYSSPGYSLYYTTPNYQITGANIDPIPVVIGTPNSELNEDTYDIRVEVYEAGGSIVKALRDPETDPGLDNQAFQTSAQDAGTSTHTLNLRAGWGIISAYVEPENAALETMFSPAAQDLIIMKSGSGKSYIPSVPVNTIGSWVRTEGYQTKMANARTLDVQGPKIAPELSASVPAGWSIIGYIRDCQTPVATALSGIVSDIIIVKDQDGRAYIPSVPVNQIGNLKPGEGYQIKMAAARTLLYPACASPSPVAQNEGSLDRVGSVEQHYRVQPTDNNATIVVLQKAVVNRMHVGDEIGIFDRQGRLAGSGVYQGENFAAAVWGNDPTTPAKDGLEPGERYELRIWSRLSEKEEKVVKTDWTLGGNTYEPDGIGVIGSMETSRSVGAGIKEISVGNYPNPFNPSTTIEISLPEPEKVRVCVYDILGRLVTELLNDDLAAGYHEVIFDPHSSATGVYYYRVEAGAYSAIRKMMFVK